MSPSPWHGTIASIPTSPMCCGAAGGYTSALNPTGRFIGTIGVRRQHEVVGWRPGPANGVVHV
jgi:hypothetical protein